MWRAGLPCVGLRSRPETGDADLAVEPRRPCWGCCCCCCAAQHNASKLAPDFEYLIDIQCRKADVALDPELVGIEAAFEIAENGFDVSRLGIHHGQYQKANVLAGGGDQKTAPITGALTEKTISNPSHCVIRRGTLPRFSGGICRAYPGVAWEVSVVLVLSRPSTRLHSAGRNNSVNTVPTNTPPIST